MITIKEQNREWWLTLWKASQSPFELVIYSRHGGYPNPTIDRFEYKDSNLYAEFQNGILLTTNMLYEDLWELKHKLECFKGENK